MRGQIAAVLAALLSLTLIPYSFSLAGRFIGWRLQKSTQQRRDMLIARTNFERKQNERKSSDDITTLDDEWEKVDRSRSRSASGDERDGGFDGIIGFFHPFWYVENTQSH